MQSNSFKEFLLSAKVSNLKVGMPFEEAWPILYPDEPMMLPSKKRKNLFFKLGNLEVSSSWPDKKLNSIVFQYGWGNRIFLSDEDYYSFTQEFENKFGNTTDVPDLFRFSDFTPVFNTNIEQINNYLKKENINYELDTEYNKQNIEDSVCYITKDADNIRISIVFIKNKLHLIHASYNLWGPIVITR